MSEISAGAQSKTRVRGRSSEDPRMGNNEMTALIVVSHCGRIRLNLTSTTSYPMTAVQQSRALTRVEVVLHSDTRKKKRTKTIAAAQPSMSFRNHDGSRHHKKRSATTAPVSRPKIPMVIGTCMRCGQLRSAIAGVPNQRPRIAFPLPPNKLCHCSA